MPEAGPFGDTFFEASEPAIVAGSLVNSPFWGWVESVVTLATQRLRLRPPLFPLVFAADRDFLDGRTGIATTSRWFDFQMHIFPKVFARAAAKMSEFLQARFTHQIGSSHNINARYTMLKCNFP